MTDNLRVLAQSAISALLNFLWTNNITIATTARFFTAQAVLTYLPIKAKIKSLNSVAEIILYSNRSKRLKSFRNYVERRRE